MITMPKYRIVSSTKSISRDLITHLVLLIVFVSIVASFLNYVFYTTKQVQDFEVQSSEDVDYLIALLTVPIWNFEYDTIEYICESFLKADGTLGIQLKVDNQQDSWFGKQSAPLDKTRRLTKEIVYKGTKLGSLTLYYTTENIYLSARNNQIKFFAAIGFILVITSVVTTLIIRKVIRKPLMLLQENMQAISAGDFAPLPNSFTHKETQQIADAFNEMRHELSSREVEIIRQSHFFRNIINSMPSPMLILDAKFMVTEFNLATISFFKQLNMPINNGQSIKEIGLLNHYREQINQAVSSGKVVQLSKENLSDWGGEHIVNIVIFPFSVQKEVNVAIRIDDITSDEDKNNALIQAQKMEVVGTLAGGLAHDFNNVLGIIAGSISLVELRKDKNTLKPEDLDKFVGRIKGANERATLMIQQLLMLAKQHNIEKKYINLENVISNCIDLGMASFDKSIKIDFSKADREKTCSGDQSKLEQVFLNLFINASHAMTQMRKKSVPWGGTLSIRIESAKLFDKEFPEASKGHYWQVAVSDTGVGISQEIIDRIYDPFFSTKQSNKGTGLGLAMVKNIIESHGGFLRCTSALGVGSTFHVYLPAERRKADDLAQNQNVEYLPQTGTILLVDDEEEIRALCKEMLRHLGFAVIEAENGQSAVDSFKTHRQEIDLILMDLVMPIKSGREAVGEILAVDPQAKVIMSSGFKRDARISEALDIGACDFLPKPYDLNKLYEIIVRHRQ